MPPATEFYRHEYPGRPRAATMSDLRRLALHNPTVKAHLRLWEDGAFISLESMLTALAVCLAEKRRLEAATIVQQPIVPRKLIGIPPEPVDRSLLDVLAECYGVEVGQLVRIPFSELGAASRNWAAEHDHRNPDGRSSMRVGIPMRRAGQNGGPPHFATLYRGTSTITCNLATCEVYAAKCECGTVFFSHPDTFPNPPEGPRLPLSKNAIDRLTEPHKFMPSTHGHKFVQCTHGHAPKCCECGKYETAACHTDPDSPAIVKGSPDADRNRT